MASVATVPGRRDADFRAMGQELDNWCMAAAEAAGLPVDPSAGVVVQNASGVIVAANDAAEILLGLTRDQLLGRTSADPRWVAVDARGDILAPTAHPAMRVVRGEGPVVDFLMGVHRPTTDAVGEHIWLTVTSVPAPSAAGMPAGSALTVFRPVGDEQASQLRLLDSERKYRLLAENASDMVTWMAPDSTILWVSPAARSVMGYEPDQLIGMRALDLVHPDDLARAESIRVALTTQGLPAPTSVVMRQRHADGSWRWIESTGRVITQNGVVTGMCTSRRDVTARVLAERERDDAVEIFRLAMEHAPVGMALLRADDTVERVNQALCQLTGRPADELLGRRWDDVVEPGAVAGQEPGPRQNGERRLRRPDHTEVWALCSVVRLPSGNPRAHALLQVQDVTAQRLERERLAAAARTDVLTGLPNRAAVQEWLGAIEGRPHEGEIGVLFVDLDGFKKVNDSCGHEVGDSLLQQVGRRLGSAVRLGDVVARFGGDEFVVLCESIDSAADLEKLADRVRAAIAEPVTIDGHALVVSASVGTRSGAPADARSLLAQADRAMYSVKHAAVSER